MYNWRQIIDIERPSRRRVWQFIVFNVGGIAFFVTGYSVFALLYGVFSWQWWQAKFVADIAGWTVNYLIQRYWAFAQESQNIRDRYILRRFILISLANVPIDYAIVGLLNWLGVSPYIGLWVSSLFFTAWKYLWYRLWVFRQKNN